jgi:hypothetical protein
MVNQTSNSSAMEENTLDETILERLRAKGIKMSLGTEEEAESSGTLIY